MSESGAVALALLGLWALASVVLAGLYAVARWGRRTAEDDADGYGSIPRIPAPWPRRYSGCITCEGAEIAGRQALIDHQSRDHTAGLRW